MTCRLAVGESQSAYALTTYANGVQPLTGLFDGFLIHSRGGATMPLGEPGRALDLADFRNSTPTLVRDDLDVPVVIVQTETDLTGRLKYLPARQPDSGRLRLWEVAGTAHADKFQIGEFEDFLGCPLPVNTGQQAYVVRAALRHLEAWARGGDPAPAADRLEVVDGAFVLDDVGNARGGVRTPAVDAPTVDPARRHRAGRAGDLPAVRQHAAAGRRRCSGASTPTGTPTWRRTRRRPTPRSPRASCSPRTGTPSWRRRGPISSRTAGRP